MNILKRRTIAISDMAYLGETSIATQAKRQLRAPLLAAFDIYKSNVAYGIEAEDEAQHAQVVTWYRSLLDLKDEALAQVPEAIARHVRG